MTQLAMLGAFLVLVGALVFFLLFITHFLGERHSERRTAVPYESGVNPIGTAMLRFSADFYLVAVFFVVFDVSAVFIFAWAVAARELGWMGYIAILVFVVETVAGLAYLWRMRAFDWGARRLAEHKERHGLGRGRD